MWKEKQTCVFVQTYWLRYQPCSFAITGPHLPTQGYIEYTPPPGGKFHNILFYCFFIVILFKTLLEVYFFALYQDLVHPLLTVYYQQRNSSFAWKEEAVARGVLPYITYTGMCRPTGSWFWSSWFRTGYPFQRRFLEGGIIFQMHQSSSFVSSDLKLFKDRLLLKIQANCYTLVAP